MSRSCVRPFVLAAVLVGCTVPTSSATREALTGGAEDDSPYATALVHTGGGICTGTMIAPDWVLTAAHCVANYEPPPEPETSRLIFGWDADGGPSNAQRASHLRANACYAHPLAAALAGDPSPALIERCSETGAGSLIDDEVDVALVHLAIPRADLEFRPIGPVRGPLRESTQTFAARVRGFSRLAGPYTGPVATGTATLDGTPVLGARAFELVLAPARVNAGDSGGPLTYGPSDGVGPVIGVAGSMDRVTSGTTATYASLLEPVTRQWIWATLDPSGACTLGASGPCVFRERTSATGDLCGDSHCTGEETPATCVADCPTSWPDSDGDGLPDIRDLCPSLDARVVSLDRLDAEGANHLDTDRDGMGDDCEPAACVLVAGFDDDLDAIQNECDNCPSLSNVDQLDCDGVGPGDACDLGTNDADADRIPDQCDNCVPGPSSDPAGFANPDQRNCNFDAEAAAGITHTPGDMGLGDLCDPNPCPDGTMGIVAREFVRRDPTAPPATVASSAAFAGTGRQTSANGSYDAPTGIRTSFRWCPCARATADDFDSRVACRGTSQCEIDFARLDEVPGDTWGWRVPSVQYPGAASSGLDTTASPSPYGACVGRDITLRPAQCIATYNPEAPLPRDLIEWVDHFRGSRPLSFVAYWDFETDARSLGALTEGPGGSRSTQGVYWYRANEYENKPAFVALLPPESCNRVGGCPTAGAGGEFAFDSDLTSHYSSGRIDSVPTGPVARPLAFLGWWIASRAACATCASSFPRPPLTQVRCPSAGCASPEIFGRLNGTRELALAPLFTAQALAALREPGALFVHASEVADERPESAVPFVTVDAATLALRSVFVDASGSLGVFQGQGGPNEPLAELRGASPETASGGALPLLVGAAGTLYRIGGLEAGAPRRYFERLRLATTVTSRVGILGEAPEEVLAVTLDSDRHEAIVLDRVPGGRRGRAHERVRILRLDLESGSSQVIASTRSFRSFTNHYLAQAPGGSFVLAVSRRGRSAGYRLVHFTLPVDPGPVTVLGSYVAHGRNLEGPIVAESMGVNVAETGSPWRPVGVRWLDFRERRDRGSDFDDCF